CSRSNRRRPPRDGNRHCEAPKGRRSNPGQRLRLLDYFVGLRPPRNDDYLISTSVTSFTRLLASTALPSRVTSMLRTMSPPPGIAQVWNFSVCGSNRTTVFGLAKDSLYHSAPLVKTMP